MTDVRAETRRELEERAAKTIGRACINHHRTKLGTFDFERLGDQINFKAGRSLALPPAHFLKLPKDAPASAVYRLLVGKEGWGLHPPSLVLSITGSARKIEIAGGGLTALRLFAAHLNSVGLSTNAWVISGGTDSGIMHMVAKQMAIQPVGVPLIGIVTWGCVRNNVQLTPSRLLVPEGGKDYDNTARKGPEEKDPRRQEAFLDPNHTHMLLVDSGVNKWGGEVSFRERLEEHIVSQQQNQVPAVLFIYGGGPNTINTANWNTSRQNPVIVMLGSGGFADIIASCALGAEDEYKTRLTKEFKGLDPTYQVLNTAPTGPGGVKGAAADFDSKVRQLVKDGQLYFYDHKTSNLEEIVVRAVLEHRSMTHEAKIATLERWEQTDTSGAADALVALRRWVSAKGAACGTKDPTKYDCQRRKIWGATKASKGWCIVQDEEGVEGKVQAYLDGQEAPWSSHREQILNGLRSNEPAFTTVFLSSQLAELADINRTNKGVNMPPGRPYHRASSSATAEPPACRSVPLEQFHDG
jgi:hypothetical protein